MNTLAVAILAALALGAAANICTAPPKFSAVVGNIITFEFFNVEVDRSLGVSVWYPANDDNRYIAYNFNNGRTYHFELVNCTYKETPGIKAFNWDVPDDAENAGTMKLEGRDYHNYRFPIGHNLTQFYSVDKDCFPRFVRIIHGEETLSSAFWFGNKVDQNVINMDFERCNLAQ